MNIGWLFNLKGIRYGYLVLGVILNMLWGFGLLYGATALLQGVEEKNILVFLLGLLIAAFAGPFLVAVLVGAAARDRRGVQYGFFGSLGGVGVLLGLALSASLFGLMMIVATLSGGLNGGLVSTRRR